MENLLKTTFVLLKKPPLLNLLVSVIESVFKFTYMLFKKRAFIIHLGSRTYKVFTLQGIPSKHSEMRGNRNALTAKFWQNDVIEVKNNLFHFSMPQGQPVPLENCQPAVEYMEKKLQDAFTYPRRLIAANYDFNKIRELEAYGLEPGLIARIETILSHVALPITSAHGDLHAGNMIYLNNEIKVIDWSMFSYSGSFITDYIHFYNYRLAKQNKLSWTVAILRNEPYLRKLSAACDVHEDLLRLAYCIRRINGEINQRKTIKDVLPKQIKKYNNILTYIVNEC